MKYSCSLLIHFLHKLRAPIVSAISSTLLFVLLLGTLATTALAKSTDVTLTYIEPNWQTVGTAKLKVLFFEVYESSLYTPTGQYAGFNDTVRLDIRYLRDFAAAALLKQTAKEWQKLDMTNADINQWLPQLANIWPDVSQNDVLSARRIHPSKLDFYFNEQLIGSINDHQLADAFLAIWLSPNTSEPDLRKQLIGMKK